MVMDVPAEHGYARLQRLDVARVLVLAVLAGTFVTSGALFSVLLATGASSEGTVRLLEGFGFSAGFFLVILSGAALCGLLIRVATDLPRRETLLEVVERKTPLSAAGSVTGSAWWSRGSSLFVSAGFQHSPAGSWTTATTTSRPLAPPRWRGPARPGRPGRLPAAWGGVSCRPPLPPAAGAGFRARAAWPRCEPAGSRW